MAQLSSIRDQITGLVLAGGRGSRMGGVDKGLQLLGGQPLALNALRRLAPQVGALMVNANRCLETYERFGFPVCSDADSSFQGPLAGFVAGLVHCATPYLATVPCDCPGFPADLVERLVAGLSAADAEIAIAVTRDADGSLQRQPVFSLMKVSLRPGLEQYMADGGRRIERWALEQRCAEVIFDDAKAFRNLNTLDELQAQQADRQV
ncbi:molybdenum cofactor guanylyltransferase MobA [Pelomonas sp. SE-A7]|uniref:molybdenum cofactor guanylyltransferase MobA n=1 Tax=Pelomonas sp. SE-A7 TaxID=3054953 RepID=UPI00259CDB85|nr:molybdenum cofactor guanylyltransferase MobA [Pelomonas sp. SE-A7]MDM4767447.1 molybdenum cofactor guanylyltransferase MobA [Pelomonas sp. SE-A7]